MAKILMWQRRDLDLDFEGATRMVSVTGEAEEGVISATVDFPVVEATEVFAEAVGDFLGRTANKEAMVRGATIEVTEADLEEILADLTVVMEVDIGVAVEVLHAVKVGRRVKMVGMQVGMTLPVMVTEVDLAEALLDQTEVMEASEVVFVVGIVGATEVGVVSVGAEDLEIEVLLALAFKQTPRVPV